MHHERHPDPRAWSAPAAVAGETRDIAPNLIGDAVKKMKTKTSGDKTNG
ncbi:hypothetical protein LA343_09775 [Corynebacterium falsenii]|nr:hypothetical protein [Corynebacterium falsenii]UBI04249.1 hypothetical protein LA343_09775 [Corynebacterium falsenii]UBI07700.1 hypothetical protein LA329_05230 [Corynebacterium falsenii]